MRVLILLLSLLASISGYTQANSMPGPADSAIVKKVKGNIKQFMRWTDHLGDNYLVLTVTDEIRSLAKTSDKELYGYHFIRKDSLIWQLNDFEKGCSFDNLVEFRNGATKITDLDNNGLSEIWIMYSLACTSDTSPRTLKLIMYQGNKKYAIRGTSQPAKNRRDEKNGGRYILSKEFQSLPQTFKDFAQQLWGRYLYDLQ